MGRSRFSTPPLLAKRYFLDCVPYVYSSLGRPDGPLGDGWTVRPYLGTSLQIVGQRVTAVGGTGLQSDAARVLSDVPSYVEVNETSHIVSPSSGAGTFVIAGVNAGASFDAWTGVAFSQGDQGDWRIWTANGGFISQAVASPGVAGGARMRLRREFIGGVWHYIGSADIGFGVTDVVSWADVGNIGQWGRAVGFVLQGALLADVPTIDQFSTDGCK